MPRSDGRTGATEDEKVVAEGFFGGSILSPVLTLLCPVDSRSLSLPPPNEVGGASMPRYDGPSAAEDEGAVAEGF